MKKVYARFWIKDNQVKVVRYEIYFKIGRSRTVSTGIKQLGSNGKSSEEVIVLESNESIKDVNAFVYFYLQNNHRFNERGFLLKVSDRSIHEEYRGSLANLYQYRVQGQPLLEDIFYTIIEFKITKGTTNQNPNNQQVQPIKTVSLRLTTDVPYGLRWVSFLREPIKLAAQKNGVDKIAIASIVFQEKFHGIWAARKNQLSSRGGTILKPTASYGFGEMQLDLAAELLGIKGRENYLEETFYVITSDAVIAMDLVAKNIAREQRRRNRKLNTFEATVFHNSGRLGLQSYIEGKIPQHKISSSIYGRSWKWQNAIALALEGIVTNMPDKCDSTNCNVYIEYNTNKWVYDGKQYF